MFYVYTLLSESDKNWFYIGFSDDLKRRFKEHNLGMVQSTKVKIPLLLIYYEAYLNKKDALTRERHLKTHQQRDLLKERIKNCLFEIGQVAK